MSPASFVPVGGKGRLEPTPGQSERSFDRLVRKEAADRPAHGWVANTYFIQTTTTARHSLFHLLLSA